ncbi:PREDICTED: uncharacterized protein LOC108612425 [Drosophila arizonae]|uniref:Uncharacterized protein LOC108612425 n=1 Tax=Drosophila arizonae TaxID=7263 RepID=A0ABM1P0Q9_DROAR|nr:PREDICTED: uncharacterized protein LOC108612425 [Drosophila arizonae]
MGVALAVDIKNVVPVPVNRKFVIQSVQTNSDNDFVEYFRKVPNERFLYTFRVVKPATSFTISITLSTVKSKRIMYKIDKLNGCQFLKNQMMNKFLSQIYRALVVNNTLFECPIRANVYFLRNLINPKIMPHFHPLGYYQLSIRIEMPENRKPLIMEILSKYFVLAIK